jgi:magnesium transporter
MNINYIQVEHSKTMMDVADKFKTHEKRTGRQPKIIVTDEGKAVGYLSGYILGQAKPQDKIDAHVRKLNTVNFDDSHKAVIKRFSENRHGSAAVLGKNGNILGIIYADDLLRLSNLQEDQSLYNFAGVSKEESVGDSISQKVRARYKWLMINLGTAFLASSVVGLFDGVIAEHVLLAVYMPIVAGMGGNAGTQTLAVMVRGISLREIELKNAWVALRREVMAGLTNGLINGLIVALVVMVINRDIQLAIVLGLAMIFSLTVAGFSGTLVPLIMHKLGKDPAASATVFITTVTDVFGFMAFLGLASLVMG